ncbi:hypothetical protein EG68_08633 [Paragonimus skrjabini miyazakii]|uniref:Trafficking protein particle complex subunit 12 n=1 Tax=Paragonimus skrjabini miyazakii TaxID=59628 RepID=A0A8S9YJG0_9TREM|nr:hypothetical protein EG68_08633 [Paragonimus skrjabini miyazakii]
MEIAEDNRSTKAYEKQRAGVHEASNSSKLSLSSYFSNLPASEDPFESVFERSVSVNKLESHSPVRSDNSKFPKSDLPVDSSTLHRLRQRDAWLPSEATRQALLTDRATRLATCTEVRPVLSKLSESDPVSDPPALLADPYRTVLLRYLKDEATVDALRCVPNPVEQTSKNIENLKELISSGWYRTALEVTRRLLADEGFLEERGGAVLTPFTAQVWLARLALLVRTRNFELAERELTSFQSLDSPNVYFEHAPELYPDRYGSIIPFSLRLLHAELPFHLNRTEESLNRLYYMLAVIARIRSNLEKGYTEDGSVLQPTPGYREASLSLWACREVRVLSSCLSIYLAELDYQAAIETVHQLAIVCDGSQPVLRGLASVLGRIYLQMGDLETAKAYFNQSVSGIDSKNHHHLATQQLFQKALLCLGKGEYEESKKLFQQVLSLDPTNVAAANNMVVCSLYLSQLDGAIRVLDTLTTTGLSGQILDTSPTNSGVIEAERTKVTLPSLQRRFCLHDALVFNLAVLYDVESDNATAKKVKLLERLARLPGEPVNIAAFKLPIN